MLRRSAQRLDLEMVGKSDPDLRCQNTFDVKNHEVLSSVTHVRGSYGPSRVTTTGIQAGDRSGQLAGCEQMLELRLIQDRHTKLGGLVQLGGSG